jgi:hypothetical protein
VAFINDDDNDVIAELERIDRFFGGDEAGDVPLEVLRAWGVEIPKEPPAEEAALRAKLMEIVEGMFEIGIVVESTDHLTDAELYRFLVDGALLEETIISTGGGGAWHISPVRDEDSDTYLRYYADDETRARWHREFGCVLPPKTKLPFDRDRLLPPHEPLVS